MGKPILSPADFLASPLLRSAPKIFTKSPCTLYQEPLKNIVVTHLDSPAPALTLPALASADYRWARDDYKAVDRVRDIGQFVTQLMMYLWMDQQSWSYRDSSLPIVDQKAARQRRRAIWVRESLLHLGPTFIKIGQFFSTRADLFPLAYVEELSKLQDQVPAFSYEQVQTIVRRELGKPIEAAFAVFEPEPIASASLGQVHRAVLKSGEEVAVKVQRPGLHRLFGIDLGILRTIAEFVQHHTPLGQDGRDWVGIYEECRRTLWEETDYISEGRNADTFRRNFRDLPSIVVPRIHWRYTSSALLTMEYVPGTKVSEVAVLEAAGLDRKAIAQLGVEAYLRQVLHHGFFHADPHPGNIAVDSQGRLIFYDFGMMGQIHPSTKSRLMLTFAGIMQKDANLVVKAMVELGALTSSSDLGPVRRSVQYMLDTYFEQALSTHESISMADISEDLYELSYDQPFRFPATFTFVLRALSTLEAMGKSLDPDFSFMEVTQPFAAEILGQENMSEPEMILNQLSRQATQFTNTSLGLPQRIHASLDKLEAGDFRLRVNSVEGNRELRKLNTLAQGILYTLLFGALFLGGTNFLIAGWERTGHLFLGLSSFPVLLLLQLMLFKVDRFKTP